MTNKLHEYIYGERDSIKFKTGNGDISIGYDYFKKAVKKADETITRIDEFEVDIFSILGMRNLSAFIGEVFASSLTAVSDELLVRNPQRNNSAEDITFCVSYQILV